MNILLLEPHEIDADGIAELDDRRTQHLLTILKKRVGDDVRAGLLGGALGSATLDAVTGTRVRLRCVFDTMPPELLPRTLVLALPRPPVLRRLLSHVASLGVGRLVLLHSARVEKSYWQTPALRPAAIDEAFRLGLEQACDTRPPALVLAQRFRPFVEDELPTIVAGGRLLLAHPGGAPCPTDVAEPTTIVVGPEGGFVPFEVEALRAAGAHHVGLGPRVLRVEVAVVALLARLGLG